MIPAGQRIWDTLLALVHHLNSAGKRVVRIKPHDRTPTKPMMRKAAGS
jgi:hypothetical protein